MPTSSGYKLLSLLQLFSEGHKPAWTAEELAGVLGISPSTCYRYLKLLVEAQLLDHGSAGYVIGPGVVALYRQLQLHDPVLRVARPIMTQLVATAGECSTVILCRLFRNQVMCVHQELHHGPQEPVGYDIGRPRPMFRGSASTTILAHLPARTHRQLYAEHAEEIAVVGLGDDWEQFRSRLKAIRQMPAIISHGEVDPGRLGVSSPIFTGRGLVTGSLSVVLLDGPATTLLVGRVAVAVATGAHVIASTLANDRERTDAADILAPTPHRAIR